MKHKLPAYAALLLFALALWTACTKPTPFGAELLDDQLADYEYDTLAVEFSVEREDSALTSDRTGAASYLLCGTLNDPLFGKDTSDLYTLLQLSDLSPDFDANTTHFDSIVMYLRYDAAGVYGDTTQAQTLRIFRLQENLDPTGDYYSNQALAAEPNEIGRVSFLPRPRTVDSLFSTTKAPYLRIRLDDNFGKLLLGMDSLTLASDTTFWRALRGLKITTAANGTGLGAMLAFDVNDAAFSRVRLYYTKMGDTAQSKFDYFFQRANKFTHFGHDYSGSPAALELNKEKSEELLYLQGLQGLRLKVQFPTAHQLDQIIVNKAELVLTATASDNSAVLPLADQLLTTELRGDSALIFTSDVTYSLGTNFSGGFGDFGGAPVKEADGATRYRLTLSQRFQQIVDADASDLKSRTLYINVYPQSRSAKRSVLYGPKSTTSAAKLELKYTRLR